MSSLTVTAYNVGFGDAILVSLPDRSQHKEVVRHILIDVGNVLLEPELRDSIFRTISRDILRRLKGRAVDLYVMTHEHMDHVQGLPAANRLGAAIPVDYAFLTASAAEEYYKVFPEAKKRLQLYRAEYERVRLAITARGIQPAVSMRAFLDNNNPRSSAACVDYLRKLPARKVSYVYNGFCPVAGRNHPFCEASLSILAPEHDTSIYYGRFRPIVPKVESGSARRRSAPPGVEPGAFKALVTYLQAGIGDNMLAIDRAANNTSIVFLLEWRGWRLLFTGDAELKSWRIMERAGLLSPVHFFKVSHHGSANGSPIDDVLDKVLPHSRPDAKPRYALLSTRPDTYPGIPDSATIRRLRSRVDRMYDTRSVGLGRSIEIRFPG
jgi:beta-lactamase superfamily II metal-dependent hydrolase